jgi:hypothetical protein
MSSLISENLSYFINFTPSGFPFPFFGDFFGALFPDCATINAPATTASLHLNWRT